MHFNNSGKLLTKVNLPRNTFDKSPSMKPFLLIAAIAAVLLTGCGPKAPAGPTPEEIAKIEKQAEESHVQSMGEYRFGLSEKMVAFIAADGWESKTNPNVTVTRLTPEFDALPPKQKVVVVQTLIRQWVKVTKPTQTKAKPTKIKLLSDRGEIVGQYPKPANSPK